MNIAFLIDDNYAEQLAVTIVSILINTKSNIKFNFYILDTGISEANKKKILKIKKYKEFNIEFIKINSDIFKNAPTIYHLKNLNYARILLPSLVNCKKILFLDCDLLVLDDLFELYNSDFENTYACVVKERLSDKTYIKNQIKKLEIKNYFNAGVMLLNLEKMRENNIEQKCLDFIEKHPEKILLLDQCVLNWAFQDNVKFVEKKYNYQYKLNYSPKKKEITIIHFVGKEKPFLGFAHPYENLYYKYLKKTPYNQNFIIFKKKMWKLYRQKLVKLICLYLNCVLCLEIKKGYNMFNWFIKEKKITILENETIFEAEENLEYLEKFKFSKTLKTLKRKLKNKTIIIYGAGAFFELIQKYYDLSDLNIIGISDRRFEEHSEKETAFGYKVYAPNEISTVNPDYILVATKNYMTIIEDLYYNIAKHSKTKIKVMVAKNFWTLLKEI